MGRVDRRQSAHPRRRTALRGLDPRTTGVGEAVVGDIRCLTEGVCPFQSNSVRIGALRALRLEAHLPLLAKDACQTFPPRRVSPPSWAFAATESPRLGEGSSSNHSCLSGCAPRGLSPHSCGESGPQAAELAGNRHTRLGRRLGDAPARRYHVASQRLGATTPGCAGGSTPTHQCSCQDRNAIVRSVGARAAPSTNAD
jgi:hypothetical protein